MIALGFELAAFFLDVFIIKGLVQTGLFFHCNHSEIIYWLSRSL